MLWSFKSPGYALRTDLRGPRCPDGLAVPEDECLAAGLEVASGYSSLQQTLETGAWAWTPCGCFLWLHDGKYIVHYDKGTSHCQQNAQEVIGLVCRTPASRHNAHDEIPSLLFKEQDEDDNRMLTQKEVATEEDSADFADPPSLPSVSTVVSQVWLHHSSLNSHEGFLLLFLLILCVIVIITSFFESEGYGFHQILSTRTPPKPKQLR